MVLNKQSDKANLELCKKTKKIYYLSVVKFAVNVCHNRLML